MDSYRTLDAWKLAHDLCIRTLRAAEIPYHARSGALLEQLRRAAVSIEANIVEGYALESRGYCLKHYRIAFGSAAEAECLIRNAAELGYLPKSLTDLLAELAARCIQVLRALLAKG